MLATVETRNQPSALFDHIDPLDAFLPSHDEPFSSIDRAFDFDGWWESGYSLRHGFLLCTTVVQYSSQS